MVICNEHHSQDSKTHQKIISTKIKLVSPFLFDMLEVFIDDVYIMHRGSLRVGWGNIWEVTMWVFDEASLTQLEPLFVFRTGQMTANLYSRG